MSTRTRNDAAPLAGGAGVNGPNSQRGKSTAPVPDGVPLWAWQLIARPDGARWAIPERDASGEVVGTAYRDASGGKTFRPGGRRGLILPWPLDAYAGSSADRPVFVAEGASDTAALLGLGLDAVGAPMAGQGGAMLAELLADRHVVIITDADDAGRRGAEKIARAMLPRCASVRIIEPPEGAKDARAAVIAGSNAAAFGAAARDARPLAAEADPPGPRGPRMPTRRAFPVEVLPAAIRDHAEAVAHAMDAPCPSMVALPALCAAASCIGASVQVLVRHGWFEPACLWGAVVASPGSTKSQTLRAAVAPIYAMQGELDAEHERAEAEYQDKLAQHKAEVDRAKREKRAAPTDAPEPPPRRQAVTGNSTPEALAHVLGANPRGVLANFDELAALFGSFGQYAKSKHGAEPGAAVYKSAFSGEPYVENRRGPDGRGRYLHLAKPLVSICGGVQPEALRGVLEAQRIHDGLASRFLFTFPPDRPGRWVPENAAATNRADRAVGRYADVLRGLRAVPLDVEPLTGRVRPRCIGLSREAQQAAADFVNRWAERTADEPDPATRAASAKIKGVTFRIALIITLIEAAERGPIVELPTIGVDALRRAVELGEWFAVEAARVYHLFNESAEDRAVRRLLEQIEFRGGTVTPRELMRSGPCCASAEDAENALGKLVEAGYGVWRVDSPSPRGGRPSRRFELTRGRTDTTDTDKTPRRGVPHGVSSMSVTSAPPEAKWADGSPVPAEPPGDRADGSGGDWGEL